MSVGKARPCFANLAFSTIPTGSREFSSENLHQSGGGDPAPRWRAQPPRPRKTAIRAPSPGPPGQRGTQGPDPPPRSLPRQGRASLSSHRPRTARQARTSRSDQSAANLCKKSAIRIAPPGDGGKAAGGRFFRVARSLTTSKAQCGAFIGFPSGQCSNFTQSGDADGQNMSYCGDHGPANISSSIRSR